MVVAFVAALPPWAEGHAAVASQSRSPLGQLGSLGTAAAGVPDTSFATIPLEVAGPVVRTAVRLASLLVSAGEPTRSILDQSSLVSNAARFLLQAAAAAAMVPARGALSGSSLEAVCGGSAYLEVMPVCPACLPSLGHEPVGHCMPVRDVIKL